MPSIAFLPWATADERMQFGAFHIVPLSAAQIDGQMPDELQPAITAILESYGKKRPVDRASVPVIKRDELTFTAEMSDDIAATYFDFRIRLAFCALAARQFFGHRYWNADNVRLVVQAFTPEGAGGAMVITRRRDGHTNNYITKGAFRETRPRHVGNSFALPRDLDIPLVHALEAAATAQRPSWPRIADAIRLFVGANSDNSDVDLHTELVDTVSAFSRLFGVWDEKDTVAGFINALPAPPRDEGDEPLGAKVDADLVRRALEAKKSIREAWLADAYRLRGKYGHGDVTAPGYPATWKAHEHLLLAAFIFPLLVKSVLASDGFYEFTADDHMANAMFDTLATYDAFAPDPIPTSGDDEDDDIDIPLPWRRVASDFQMRRVANLLTAEFERTRAVGDTFGQ
jgi:hypothetical protein